MSSLQPRISACPRLPTWSWLIVDSLIEFPASLHDSTAPVVFKAASRDDPTHAAGDKSGGRCHVVLESVLRRVHGVRADVENVQIVEVPQSPGLALAEFHPDARFLPPGPHYFVPLVGLGESYALFPHLLGLAVVPVPESAGCYERVGFLSLDLGPGCREFTAADLKEEMIDIVLV